MKKVKSLILAAKDLSAAENDELNTALWNFIMYSPKMPLRLHQQQVLDDASTFKIEVYDEYFNQGMLSVNGFKWGTGSFKVLLTHGWGAKALDFVELITRLRENNHDLEIYAFDAPGNGSSGGDLTNLLLYEKAIQTIVAKFGMPDAFIGHSFGAMANILALTNCKLNQPKIIVSISPLIRLKEHFVSMMCSVNASEKAQDTFLRSVQLKFNKSADIFNLVDLYKSKIKHFLAYDSNDLVAPHNYLAEFLSYNPEIENMEFNNIGHEKMHKDPFVIDEIAKFLEKNLRHSL